MRIMANLILVSQDMIDKIKIVIIIDTYILEAWKYYVVKELANTDYINICNVLISPVAIGNTNKRKANKDPFVIRILERLTSAQNANILFYDSPVDSSDLLRNIPSIEVQSNEADLSDIFGEAIRIDIIVNLSKWQLPDSIVSLSTFGLWKIRPDYRLTDNGIFSDFWALVKSSSALTMTLEIQDDRNSGEIRTIFTYESVLPFSQHINRNKAFWRASLLIPRVIDGVYMNGMKYLDDLTSETKYFKSETYEADFVRRVLRKLNNCFIFFEILIKQIIKKLFYEVEEEWRLMINLQNEMNPSFNFSNFKTLNPIKGLFWADPFIITFNNKYYLFVEELNLHSPNGHISVLELDRSGKFLHREIIIEKPYHMSYPFVFKYGDEYFMIPETSANKTIDMYRCSEFPYKWEFYKTIMSGLSAVDTTLFEYDGKWWLFTSVDKTAGNVGLDTDLFIFYSDNPLNGRWIYHPLNPVVSDVRSARPAGKIFYQHGNIYRPSQNCSGRYGKAFNICRIKVLSETRYEEEIVRKIEPDWDKNLKGAHTFNFDNGLTVIDVYAFRQRKLFGHESKQN